MEKPVVNAVTVNHNTSAFTELMLRSLFAFNDMSLVDLRAHILDNGSDDSPLPELKEYAAANGIEFSQTGFNSDIHAEKHGEAFRRFVMENDQCSHYLFLDPDMWFVERNTVPAMLDELAAQPRAWAVQARIYGYYFKDFLEGRNGNPEEWCMSEFTMPVKLSIGTGDPRSYTADVSWRSSPVCSLVKNTPLYRNFAEQIGLSPAIVFRVSDATYYDTFGIVTRFMDVCGRRHIVSSKTVFHFAETAYKPELRAVRDEDCAKMLKEMREGRDPVRRMDR